MEIIDFDLYFKEFTDRWFSKNKKKYKSIEDMENHMPEIYFRWENSPAKWLGDITPIEYFGRINDTDKLLKMLVAYNDSGLSVPDILLNRLVDLGEQVEDGLIGIAFENDTDKELRMIALNMLNEIESGKAFDYYIKLIRNREEDDELADCAVDGLLILKKNNDICEMLIKELVTTNNCYAKLSFLEILLNDTTTDERIYVEMVRMFLEDERNKALIASFIGKYGDARAIHVLAQEIKEEGLTYLEYLEIKNAIEELGGHIELDRDFSGDNYYEALKNI